MDGGAGSILGSRGAAYGSASAFSVWDARSLVVLTSRVWVSFWGLGFTGLGL